MSLPLTIYTYALQLSICVLSCTIIFQFAFAAAISSSDKKPLNVLTCNVSFDDILFQQLGIIMLQKNVHIQLHTEAALSRDFKWPFYRNLIVSKFMLPYKAEEHQLLEQSR